MQFPRLRHAKSALLLLLMVSAGDISAQRPEGKASPKPQPAAVDILTQRYEIDFIHADVSPAGALQGLFTIAGDLTPPGLLSRKPAGVSADPRNLAAAFIAEESELFGIAGCESCLRLSRILSDSQNGAHLVFHRRVGPLRLDGMEIRFHVDADGRLYAIDGRSVLLTASDEQAILSHLAEARLTKQKVAAIVQADLQFVGVPGRMLEFPRLERLAIAHSPFLVWKAEVVAATGNGRWLYEIDAVSGEILARVDGLDREEFPSTTAGAGQSVSAGRHPGWLTQQLPWTEGEKPDLGAQGYELLERKEGSPLAPLTGFKQETPRAPAALRRSSDQDAYSRTEEADAKRRSLQ